MEKNLTELVAAAQKGNNLAFEKLFEATKNAVYYTCLGFVKNEADAKDLMQETYITAFQKIEGLTQPDRFTAWLYRIAINKCKDFLAARKAWLVSSDEADEIENIPDTDLESLPESYIAQKDQRHVLLQIMQSNLSNVQYQTIFLFYFNELSIAEIAGLMDCSENTVKSRLHLAKAKLKEGITMYEKKNDDKLFAALPFLVRFFRAEARELSVPPVQVDLLDLARKGSGRPGSSGSSSGSFASEGSSASGSSSASQVNPANVTQASQSVANGTANTAASADVKAGGFFASAGAKIAVAILCAVIVIGGIAAIANMVNNQSRDDDRRSNKSTTNEVVESDRDNDIVGTLQSNDINGTEQSEDISGGELTPTETEATVNPNEAVYEDQGGLELFYNLEDVDFTIIDIAVNKNFLNNIYVLTSDYIIAGLEDDGTLKEPRRVSPQSVRFYDNGYNLVENEDGSYTFYKRYRKDGEVASIEESRPVEGINPENICYINAYLNKGEELYALYLDGSTVMYTNFIDPARALTIKAHFSNEIKSGVRELVSDYFLHSYILFENGEVYNTPGHNNSIDLNETTDTIVCFDTPTVTDVNKLYAYGLHYSRSSYIYEKIGDDKNIHICQDMRDAEAFVVSLPEKYTTADISSVVTSWDGLLVEFSDGSIYVEDYYQQGQLIYCEELTLLNQEGHILKIIGSSKIYILMDDHHLYTINVHKL